MSVKEGKYTDNGPSGEDGKEQLVLSSFSLGQT